MFFSPKMFNALPKNSLSEVFICLQATVMFGFFISCSNLSNQSPAQINNQVSGSDESFPLMDCVMFGLRRGWFALFPSYVDVFSRQLQCPCCVTGPSWTVPSGRFD